MYPVQYVELLYLGCKGYWLYSLIIVLFTLANTLELLQTLLAHEAKMVNLVNRPRLVPMVLGGWVRAAGSHRLVPGDILVLQRGQATCDMVLLRGSCLVEESMLSGEVKCAFHTTCRVSLGLSGLEWASPTLEVAIVALVLRASLPPQ